MRDLTADSPGPEPPAPPAVNPAPAYERADPTGAGAVVSRSERRRQRRRGLPWKSVVTVVLLLVLAAAVTVVLLQSAGLISWGFLGPTA